MLAQDSSAVESSDSGSFTSPPVLDFLLLDIDPMLLEYFAGV
jgi:hypothetical protein